MEERVLELIALLEASGDLRVDRDEEEAEVSLTLLDFEGFDDDWSEVFRSYSEPELVDEFEELIEGIAEGDYYQYFEIGGMSYCLGESSMDI